MIVWISLTLIVVNLALNFNRCKINEIYSTNVEYFNSKPRNAKSFK